MTLLLSEKVSVSPLKKPLIETWALTSSVLSESLAAAEVSNATGVLFSDAGLLTLSVKVGLVGVIASVGALSSEKPFGAGSTGWLLLLVKVGMFSNSVGVPPDRLPT